MLVASRLYLFSNGEAGLSVTLKYFKIHSEDFIYTLFIFLHVCFSSLLWLSGHDSQFQEQLLEMLLCVFTPNILQDLANNFAQ